MKGARGVCSLVATAIVFAAAGAPRTAQQTSPHTFDAHTFAITIPPGYTLADEATPMPGYKTMIRATVLSAPGAVTHLNVLRPQEDGRATQLPPRGVCEDDGGQQAQAG